LKKRKGIFNINIGCGPKPGQKPSPTQQPSPTLTRPSRSSAAQPARPHPRSVKRSQSRGSRPHDAAPGRAHPANPDPNLAGVRSCLPRTPPQRPVSFPRTTTTKSKQENLSPTKPIVVFSPNPQQTRHESSIRLEGISGTMLRPCWTLWSTNRSTQAPP
jgi:hypothetical protein